MSGDREKAPWLPPRWFVRFAWYAHRAVYQMSGGRLGLWRPKGTRWGTMRLTTTGRRTGRARSVILGYFEDGPNLVTLAMNGWADSEPAWWLNLQDRPDATVDLPATSLGGRPRATNGHGCGPGGVSSIRSWTGSQLGARRKPRLSSCSPVPVRRRSDLRTAHGNRRHRSQYSL